ncbi:PREDICTED: glutamate-rich protein 6B [Chinchilla lanigera]|uniref:glutamate-rich protein 6B n=1 Tax=Chinchilla lanigera TaxID=34839 RepID=UPI0006970425|nr:PREDICTED: glutamate-rich protein 6B [Chinchilla lanigera]
MSSEKDLPTGSLSSHPARTTSEHSTQTLSSEGEDTDVELDEKNLQDEVPFSREQESLEEKEYSEEEEFLEEEDYPEEEEFLEEEEYPEEEESLERYKFLEGEYHLKGKDLFKEEDLEEEMHVAEKEYPFKQYLEPIEFEEPDSTAIVTNLDARSSTASTFQESGFITIPSIFTTPAPASETAIESAMESTSCCLMVPTPSLRHQASQTEWTYEGTSSKLKPKTEPRISLLSTMKSDLEDDAEMEEDGDDAMDIYKKTFWDSLLTEQEIDKEEVKKFHENFLNSSYQTVFNTIIKEIALRKELEEDLDIPMSKLLESGNKRKLAILLKKNFEIFKDAILLLMKRREQMTGRKSTYTFYLSTQPNDEEEPKEVKEQEEVKKDHPIRRHYRRKIELDKEWIQKKSKVHRGDGKLILYSNENIFQILFPDGTGQIHYPSGNLALLISCTGVKNFIYIILEDSEKMKVRALINNSGHATFYDEHGAIWLNLSRSLGHYFPKGRHQKTWNWWDLSTHVHAPPIKCISLKINHYIQVQIRSQDQIIFCFFHERKRVCLNLGTKYKYISPDLLNSMKKRAVLEVEPGPTAQKIQILLGKMSRILNFLTIPDLENFVNATTMWKVSMYLGNSMSQGQPPNVPASTECLGSSESPEASWKTPKTCSCHWRVGL